MTIKEAVKTIWDKAKEADFGGWAGFGIYIIKVNAEELYGQKISMEEFNKAIEEIAKEENINVEDKQ